MLHIIDKALSEIEAMPSEKRQSLAHLDKEIEETVAKLKDLKEKLEKEGDDD